MKIPTLLAALAIASGSALATGTSDSATHRDATADTAHARTVDGEHRSGPSFVEKTKRAFHRMGDKLRRATHTDKDKDRTESAARHDTRSMGAAGSDTHDGNRRQRMDDAYSNYQNKHDKSR